jgi:hypothetical protein
MIAGVGSAFERERNAVVDRRDHSVRSSLRSFGPSAGG